MIHEEICTYEVCKLAKEKGFNVPTFGYYRLDTGDWYRADVCADWNDSIIRSSAPTQSLLQRWLREEKSIQIVIRPKLDNLGAWIWGYYHWTILIFNECRPMRYSISNGYNSTYELALEDALKYALENLV
jgi:hypothetical protein